MENKDGIRTETLNALHPLPKGRGLTAKEDKKPLTLLPGVNGEKTVLKQLFMKFPKKNSLFLTCL